MYFEYKPVLILHRLGSSFLHVSLRTIQYLTPSLKLSNGDSLVRKVTRIYNGCSRNRGYFCSSGVKNEKSYMSTHSWHA